MAWSALAALLFVTVGPAPAAEPAPCDRACLDGMMDQYLSALAAHDAKRLPLAATVRFTEDGQTLALGDGLWGTISGLGTYRHLFEDPAKGEVAFFGTIREGDAPTLLVARLKVTGGKIAEIETIVARNSNLTAKGVVKLEAMAKPNSIWQDTVPPAERATREQLAATANMYFSGLQNDDGKGVYPFADDCNRIENGMQTTNNPGLMGANTTGFDVAALGCKAQFESGFYHMVTRIRGRRFVLVDPEHGVVFTFAFFDHNGTVRQVTLANGKTMPIDLKAPFTWELGEAFKIEQGKIHLVEAVMTQSPYGMKPGWPE